MYDLIYSEYANPQFLFDSEINFALEIIEKMQERRKEEKIFQRWIFVQSEISYEDFKKSLISNIKQKENNKNSKDILKNVKNILENINI